jgi:signal transduction histidine kinase
MGVAECEQRHIDFISAMERQITEEYRQKLFKRHMQGALVRSGASTFMWLFLFFCFLISIVDRAAFLGATSSVAFLILINPPTLWALSKTTAKGQYAALSLSINILEVIGYTSIIYFLGGLRAAFLTPVYAALITYVGVVAPRRLPFLIAGFCALAFTSIVALEHIGVLPPQNLGHTLDLPWGVQLFGLLATVGLLFVVAFISSYTAHLLKTNRQKMRDQNRDLQKSREEVSRAAERLREKNTQLKTAMQKAQESDRMKSEFLANMSHELRTPLNHIIGFTELILDENFGQLNETQKEYLTDVLQSSRHLLSLINDILDLSKVEAGKMELDLSDVNPKMLLEGSLVMIKEKATKQGIELTTEIDAIPEVIKADERKLKQVMYNLLSNAVKFTPKNGKVTLRAEQVQCSLGARAQRGDREQPPLNGNWVLESKQEAEKHHPCIMISVSDTGIGIKSDDLTRIFFPFEQGDGSAAKTYQGTGLGLAITKKMVELHGGRIWAESDGEGKGSTFCFIVRN